MKPIAIVFTSNTGHTEAYARLLGKQAALPVYSLAESETSLQSNDPILYLGWIHAGHVKGFSKADKRFTVCAVCGVGLCDTGTQCAEVRKATAISADIPLFTLQGGLKRDRLKRMDRLMLRMLTKGLSSQKQQTPQEARMLELLQADASYVCEEHLHEVLQWYRKLIG